MSDAPRALAPATVTVTAGRPPRQPDAPLNPPVVLASTYHAGGDLGYGRYGNETWSAFEQTLGALDGGTALTFASGMAAVSAVVALVPPGGVVVVPTHAYLGVHDLLRDAVSGGRLADVRVVDVADTTAVVRATAGADLVWVESPTNPMLEVADLPAIAAAARTSGALLAFDETFLTPLVTRGLDLGADVVVHSVTKYLAGHSDVVLGAVVTRDEELAARLLAHRSRHGSIPGTLEAWLALRGVRTLALRVERAQQNAAVLAERLAGQTAVERVRYPGFGAILAIEVRGGAAGAQAVSEAVRLWVHATSLGGVESSLERRRRWPGESPTVPESLLRLSVGIEDVEDLWADLSCALAAAAKADA